MLYLTLRQLEYVAAIAQAGSLSAAAAALNLSQPALSVALNQVENHLGQPLFARRKGARLALTDFGRSYVEEVEDLLARARRLQDPAALRVRAMGALTIGCFEDLAPVHLAPLLGRLRECLPGVALRWRTGDFETLARGMLEGQLDLSLTYDLGLDASFHRRVVGHAAPQAFVAPDLPLGGQARVSLAELARHPLILFEEGLSIRHMLALFRAEGLSPRVAHRVRSLELMRSLAAHGEGVGISYTRPPADRTYDGRRVVSVPIADGAAREPLILARSSLLPPSGPALEAEEAIAAWMASRDARE